jgi:hypothetical protein
MDPVRLREIALDFLKLPYVSQDVRELVTCFKLLTCPDPLTLDRAKEVMGREPDATSDCGTCIGWETEDVSVWQFAGGLACFVPESTHYNPTVGQFACLALAAKQGGGS